MNLLRTILIFISFVIALQGSEDNEFRKIEASQVQLWEQTFENATTISPDEKFTTLWLGLRNMGMRHSTGRRSSGVDSIFLKLQQEFLQTPGHAQYFADEIEKERRKYTEDQFRHLAVPSFSHMRYSFIQETLVHLPSPETIEVLGNYLHDERDARPSDVPPQNWITTPANSFLAAESLSSIGLNDSPIRKGTFVDSAVVEKWRAWYDEVKSGQRSFSFRGQNISYRFKADGTVETIPRDASKDRPEPPDPQSNGTTADPRWAVSAIAGTLAMIVLIAAYLWRKRFKGNA